MTTQELIAALDAAERKATPGPWTCEREPPGCSVTAWVQSDAKDDDICGMDSYYDAQFIAISRNAARPLLDEIARLQSALRAAEAQAAAMQKSLQIVRYWLPDVAQLLDGWHADGTSWSEWDESVRQQLSKVQEAAEVALGIDAGTGWHSPEEWDQVQKELKVAWENRNFFNHALNQIGDMLLGKRDCHAPDAVRRSVEELQAQAAVMRQALVKAAVPLEALHASVKWELCSELKEEIATAVEETRDALASDAGKGWHSPEEWEQLQAQAKLEGQK